MSQIVIQTTLNGTPVNGLANAPQIDIVELATDTTVVTGAAMTDVGSNGFYKFLFTGGVQGVEYAFNVDADPTASGQVDDRYFSNSFDYEITDLWNDHGLNPAQNKTITENTPQTDYDEAVTDPNAPDISKSVVKAGSVTTINRA